MQDNQIVYSTDLGKISSTAKSVSKRANLDGIIRIRRETKGRKGKGVTTLSGFDLPEDELKQLAKNLEEALRYGWYT